MCSLQRHNLRSNCSLVVPKDPSSLTFAVSVGGDVSTSWSQEFWLYADQPFKHPACLALSGENHTLPSLSEQNTLGFAHSAARSIVTNRDHIIQDNVK